MYSFEPGDHEFQYHEPRGVSKPRTPPRATCDPDPVAEKQVLKEFKDCFEGFGCFQGKYDITDDPAVSPIVHPPFVYFTLGLSSRINRWSLEQIS